VSKEKEVVKEAPKMNFWSLKKQPSVDKPKLP
jgi:hypothetical protein